MAKRKDIRTIKIEDIVLNEGTQIREEIDQDLVKEYAARLRDGDDFPPIVVFSDGTKTWLADGFHRVYAALKLKRKTISCEYNDGTWEDAMLHAVGANAFHGKRRTNADKRNAVLTLVKHHKWSAWSNRKVADTCGVSHFFVNKVRDDLYGSLNKKLQAISPSAAERDPTDTTPNGVKGGIGFHLSTRQRDEESTAVSDDNTHKTKETGDQTTHESYSYVGASVFDDETPDSGGDLPEFHSAETPESAIIETEGEGEELVSGVPIAPPLASKASPREIKRCLEAAESAFNEHSKAMVRLSRALGDERTVEYHRLKYLANEVQKAMEAWKVRHGLGEEPV